ncbi:MAG: AbrB/MazE/SpoVT family DNA-binding domain-containing protein [Oscillospiraceae bacterium]|nr:AbrB/MazE/SpoVT family DNA-binding domain-containing protein [Oscillospiraceae bacterium]
MKEFARNIDPLGRIVIPKELREQNGIEEGDALYIKATTEGITLVPLKSHCVICGTAKDLVTVDNISVCRKCGGKIIDRFTKANK